MEVVRKDLRKCTTYPRIWPWEDWNDQTKVIANPNIIGTSFDDDGNDDDDDNKYF